MFFTNINVLFPLIVVAICVNFLRIFKVYNFAHFHEQDRGIAENGTSWLCDIISGITMFCFREEYMQACDSVSKLLQNARSMCCWETVAIQDTQDRVFLFIRYLYPDETQPETRKRAKKWADLCKAKNEEPSRISSILGTPLLLRNNL